MIRMLAVRPSWAAAMAGLLALGLVALGPLAVVAHTDTTVAADEASPEGSTKQQRGLVREGLTLATSGRCEGAYEIRLRDGGVLCTHGPDPAPPGVDVTERPSVRELRSATRVAASSGVPCIGDGVSGPRIQAIYAVAAPALDRFASVAPLIRQYAADMDEELSKNAQAAGSDRHLRWVTQPDCSLDIDRVLLSPAGDDTFADTIDELRALGYDQPDRKYHVWFDADVYCGIGNYWLDDQPGVANLNERRTTYARTDTACWGYAELHELFHNLGTVMTSAPNSDGDGHCTDEADLMCYGPAVVDVCPAPAFAPEWIDCNQDDYFNVSPPAGSYLASHWNTADSIYLTGSLTQPPAVPTRVTATTLGTSSVRVTWDDVPAEDGYRIRCGDSLAVCKGGLAAGTTSHTLTDLAPGTRYPFRVCAFTGGGESCSPEVSATTTPGPLVVDDRSAGFTKAKPGWTKQTAGWDGRSFWTPVRTSSVYRSAAWTATFAQPGRYEVWVRYPKANATTRRATYRVVTEAGVVKRTRDQRATAGRWLKLGAFDFGTVAKVTLSDKTGERTTSGRRLVVDVVKFVPVASSGASVPRVVAPDVAEADPATEPNLTPAPTAEPTPAPDLSPSPTPEPNQPPVADAGGPYTLEEGSTVKLDGRGSSDPDGEIVSWSWSKPGRLDDATLADPGFRGTDDGRIAIELTVTDDDGATATHAARVKVTNADPVIKAIDLVRAAATVTLDVAIDDPGPRDTHVLHVDWGDGTSDTVALEADVSTASLTHTYAGPGERTITLTVTDDDGGSATTDLVVTIASPPSEAPSPGD